MVRVALPDLHVTGQWRRPAPEVVPPPAAVGVGHGRESCGRLCGSVRHGCLGGRVLPDEPHPVLLAVRLHRVLDGEVVAVAISHAAGHWAASRSAQAAGFGQALGNQE